VPVNQGPAQKVRYPNVAFSTMKQFEQDLDKWFGRKNIPVWVTEYGNETKPGEPKGVTTAQQSAYLRTAINIAANDPRVGMFIWFIVRDDPTSAWQSGLLNRDGSRKPAFGTFAALANRYDGRNPQIKAKPNVTNPFVRFAALELWSRSGPGAKVGLTVAVYDGRRLLRTAQPVSQIGQDGWVAFRAPLRTVAGHNYNIQIKAGDIHGNYVSREVLLRVPIPDTKVSPKKRAAAPKKKPAPRRTTTTPRRTTTTPRR